MHAINKINGRKTCTKETPMPKGDTGRWEHDNTRQVGHQENGWPSGDIIKVECLNCGLTWKEELPQ